MIRTPNLYQNWGLFTNPNRKLQWYVAKAELESGDVRTSTKWDAGELCPPGIRTRSFGIIIVMSRIRKVE